MEKPTSKKQAVIIIHGIGNQYPMETAKEFVENIKEDSDILYSSPDREANYFETRRLSLSQKKTDFYEFYWANLISEPKLSELYFWVLKLLFCKKPSSRVQLLVWSIRILTLSLLFTFGYIVFIDIQNFETEGYLTFTHSGIFALVSFVLLKFIVPIINSKAAQTVGDAVKYLTPSPQNIESRYKIRKKGIQLLKKLHEKTDEDGQPLYQRIIIVGHSLGSVVAYDLITNLWHEYMYEYHPDEFPAAQPILEEMTALINQSHQQKEQTFPIEQFRELQKKLFKEIKKLKNPWLISDFISIGSPLCHGDYILTKNFEEFDKKTNYREYPLCPPKIEVKKEKNAIVKDYDNAISFSANLVLNNKGIREKKPMRFINHNSQFSFIQWTNIYFQNDFVGGELNEFFGKGIQNVPLKANGNWIKRNLPFFSHTNYWSKSQQHSIDEILKQIF